jgi:TatD DNase family protein
MASIREIEEKQIYTIAVTNLPDLYRKESVEIASKYIRFALGFHPELIHQYKSHTSLFWDLLPEVRYIGEVGLDLVDKTYQKEQESFFCELVERCRYDSKKIFTIHSRQAVDKVLDTLGDNYRFKAILHWFSGSRKELEGAIERGCYFSINGAMMRSKRFVGLLPLIPSDRILLETDSPFIDFNYSHTKTLQSISSVIKEYMPDVDIWSNFRRILE